MLSIFSPKLLYAADIDSDSLIMEDSNNLQTTKNGYSGLNHAHDFNFIAVGDWSCNKEAQKTAVIS